MIEVCEDQEDEEFPIYEEEEEDLSLVTNVLQVPKKEMENDEWLRSSYENM